MHPSSTLERGAILASCSMLVVGLAAVDFFNPSLPYIMASFDATEVAVKNLAVVYLVVLGLAQFAYGSLSDRIGRRPLVVAGLVISAAGMLLCAQANSLTALYLGRVVTACGSAACTVMARAVIVDVFHTEAALRRGFGYFATSSQLSPALAPLAGAWIQEHAGWRVVFLCMAVVTVAAALLLSRMRETHHPDREPGPAKPAWVAYARLLRDRKFLGYSAASALIFVFTFGFYASAPYAFHALGFNAMENASSYLIYAAGLLCGAMAVTRRSGAWSARRIYGAALGAYVVVLSLAVATKPANSLLWAVLLAWVLGAISGIAAPLALALGLGRCQTDKGAASAVQGAVKMAGAGLAMLAFDLVRITDFAVLLQVFLGIAMALALVHLLLCRSPRSLGDG